MFKLDRWAARQSFISPVKAAEGFLLQVFCMPCVSGLGRSFARAGAQKERAARRNASLEKWTN